MVQPHFLVVTYPAQGHINPALQFAKRLIRIGIRVTLTTCVSAERRMAQASFPDGLLFTTFSDGYDDGFKPEDDHMKYMSELKRRGSEKLTEIITSSSNDGKPITCVIYTLLLPWAAEVASTHQIPSTLLWIQPATVLGIYYYYFNGYEDEICKCSDPSHVVKLPGFPPMINRDLPSFIVPSNPYNFMLWTFEEQIKMLKKENNKIKLLVNTFDALETNALKAINELKLIGIGPLLPSAYLDGKDPSDKSFGGDLFKISKEYINFLNSKQKSSVIYISFGSFIVLSKKQKEEIANALLKIDRPFLWVIREDPNTKNDEEMSFKQELEEKGLIIPWCNQVEVLSHPSIGCFVTHCGWNSTTDSLVCGIPIVAFPHWTDQGTNAKLIEDEWKCGVRVVRNEEGVVENDELKKCVELVMGDSEKGEEIRKNADKWKYLARDAVKDGGSSDVNLKGFVDEIDRLGCLKLNN